MYALAKDENSSNLSLAGRTLEVLEAIGFSMAAYPGRKNLIRATSDVPFLVFSNIDLTTQHGDSMTLQNFSQSVSQSFSTMADSGSNLGPKLARTMRLLADSQVSVYLVDVQGLPTVGLTAADQAVGAGDNSTQVVRDSRSQQVTANWSSRDTINSLAEATGARTFTGTNDLSRANNASMEEGAHYYTLA